MLAYYALTFAISWGGFLLIGGAGLLAGTSWQADSRFLLAVQAMLAGPPAAGILMTALVSGRAGLRDLGARLLRWRVGGRWYGVAFLVAPLLQAAVLLALARGSAVFLPGIATAGDRGALILAGLAIGLAGGLVEELGWTGFAIPVLRRRRGVLATGVTVGVLWGLWHGLQMWWVGSTSAAGVPQAIFMTAYLFTSVAQLTAFRVLMVWVYDRTRSLLLATFMHASYIATTLFILAPPIMGRPFLTYATTFAAALWAVVGLVAAANRGHWSSQAAGAA